MLQTLLVILALPLIVLIVVLIGAYKLFFSWWLGPVLHRREHRRFAQEIRTKVPSLFVSHGGSVLPYEHLGRSRAYAIEATVALDGMLLLFVRHHGELAVSVCPPDKTGEWWEISSLLEGSLKAVYPRYYALRDFGRFFEANYNEIAAKVANPSWRKQGTWLVPLT